MMKLRDFKLKNMIKKLNFFRAVDIFPKWFEYVPKSVYQRNLLKKLALYKTHKICKNENFSRPVTMFTGSRNHLTLPKNQAKFVE